MPSKFLDLSGLKECIEQKNSLKAKECVNSIARFFDDNLTKAELEFALEVLFHPQSGTLGFLLKSYKERKLFKDSNIIIFDLWIRLIQNYAKEVNFISYLDGIIQCCKKYITLTIVSAKEREKAAIVLQEVYRNKLLNDLDSSELVTKCLEIFQLKNQPATFTQEICRLLGIISKNSPHDITKENEIRLRDTYIKILEDILLSEEGVQYNLLTGAMEGLNYFLCNFAPSESLNLCERIYTCVKKLCGLHLFKTITSKSQFRAALDVFTNHASLFAKQIFKDFNYWNECLEHWVTSRIYEERKKGLYAISTFHQIIANQLNNEMNQLLPQSVSSSSSSSFTNYETNKTILKILIQDFRKILEDSSSEAYRTRIAIRGFGLLSGLCKQFLNDQLQEILILVTQRTELISFIEDKELKDVLEHFPDYIQSLSQMIVQIQDENTTQILSQNIKNITIRLIRDFHYLSLAHTGLVVNSLCNAFHNLSTIDNAIYENIIEKITFEGVIWTCSHKLIYEAQLDWNNKEIDWKDNVTYKSYLPLWEGLLREHENEGESSFSRSFNKSKIAKIIFDNLMSTVFQILDKLNLQLERRTFTDEFGNEQEFYFYDPNYDLYPKRIKDFHIFINLIDFYRDLFWFKSYRREYFRQWINEYCQKMINFSYKNPLISGFLKLLQCGLSIAEYLNYFQYDEIMMNDDDNSQQQQQNLILYENESHRLQLQLLYFLRNLIDKSQKYTGELQITIIELILRFPIKFYQKYLTDMIAVLKISLNLGKNLIWLAKLSVQCLDRINDYYYNNDNDLKKLYKEILPYLDSYLQSKGFNENPLNVELIPFKQQQQQRTTSMSRRKIRRKINKKFTEYETELYSVQKLIVQFLGKLEPQNAALLISSSLENDHRNENLVKWDVKQNIRIALNLPDINQSQRPIIYLDNIIPRICYLAQTSSDRRTKINACELIHAIIIYVIGTKQYYGKLWKELCKCMLQLGSDNDLIVQQLFEPLLKQIMHFMSKYENLGKENTEILIDSLMEGISSSFDAYSNSALQDLSATLLREFVEWSIKQTTPQQLAASPVSINALLSRLKLYSFDSSLMKRNGAALVFNNLYRILREEESICDLYFIDLFYTFCINFKLTEEFSSFTINFCNDNDGIQNSDLELVSMSLKHVLRVLKERNYLFNKIQSKRIIPKVMKEATLQEVIKFLFNELIETKLMYYRHKCIEMIETLILCLDNITSIALYLKKFIKNEMLYEICEGSKNGCGIKARPNLNYIKNIKNTPPYLLVNSWLEHFLGSLDFYCWFMNDYMLHNPEILFEDNEENNSIRIFDVITYYLQNICWNDVHDILNDIYPDLLNESISTVTRYDNEEKLKIDSIKCIICVRILDFLAMLLKCGENCIKKIPQQFWINNNEILIKFLTQLIYKPQNLNFDYRSKNISQKLPQRIENLLNQLIQHCPDLQFIHNLQNELMKELIKHLKCITKVSDFINTEHINEENFNILYGIEFSIRNLKLIYNENENENDEITMDFMKITSRSIIHDLFSDIKQTIFNTESIVKPTSEVKKFLNHLMKICFMIDNNDHEITENVINYILDESKLHVLETDNIIRHGEHFYKIYKSAIFEQCKVTSFIEQILNQLFIKMNKDNVNYIHQILMDLLGFLYKYHFNDHDCLEKVTDLILMNAEKILNNSDDEIFFIEIISELAKITSYPLITFKQKCPILKEWIFDSLRNRVKSLGQKSKIIYLLPLLIGSDSDDDGTNDEIRILLENLQRQHFPLKSSEFEKGTLQEITLKSAFRALLNAMVTSKSFILLEFMIKCTSSDSKHIFEWMIYEELKIVIKKLNDEQQINWLNKVLIMTTDKNLESTIRQTICKRFLLNMIQNSNENSIIKFYTHNIKLIESLTDTNYAIIDGTYEIQQALMNRIIGFSLIEIMCASLSKEILINKECQITKAYFSGTQKEIQTGSELIAIFLKKCLNVSRDPYRYNDKELRECYRLYQCSAYCAKCSLLCNTQGPDKLALYEKLLFIENPDNNQYIWQLLIDKDKSYEFQDQELENYLGFKERFVSIRKLNATSPLSSTLIDNQSIKMLTSSKRLRTQNIFQSSLSQDVSKIDFNNSLVRSDIEVQSKLEEISLNLHRLSVKLESHEINNHEIMPTLCAVIQFMVDNQISPLPDNPTIKRSYNWIKAIADSMSNSQNHENIRIFLAQLVDNCRNVFQYFAHIMFRPILEVIVDGCAGNKLNFFTTDLIALLLSWSSKNFHKPSSSNEIRLISALLKFVMKNAWHERREIFKFNIELIKTMLNLWKDIVMLPYQLIYDMIIRTQRNDSHDNECGIILTEIILENDLLPWIDNTRNEFIKSIFSNLYNEYQSVYFSAAQVFGIILKNLSSQIISTEIVDFWKYELVQKLEILKNKKDTKCEKKFIDILYAVQKNYPEILGFYLEYIIHKIPNAIDIMKYLYLEMFLSCIEKICNSNFNDRDSGSSSRNDDNIYDILISISIIDLLKNYRFQLYALHIINRSLPKLKRNEILQLFPILEEYCCKSENNDNRDITYEIMIYISKNYNGDIELQKKSNTVLLRGLNDSDIKIQQRIFQFWSYESNIVLQQPLPSSSTTIASPLNSLQNRILSLIENFNNDYDKQFLGFSTQLLLQLSVEHPDSKCQIFEYENDHDMKLYEYEIHTSLPSAYMKSPAYSLPPLFSTSQHQQQQHHQNNLLMLSTIRGTQLCNFIRDTQNRNYFFEPTQDPNKMLQGIKTNFTLPTSNSLPFITQSQILDRRSQKLNSKQQICGDGSSFQDSDDIDRIFNNFRSRMLKNKEKENRTRILKNIDNLAKKRNQIDIEKKKKESQVILYRRYRYGDYPDFLINFLAILLPLQGLVKNDSIIARQIFVSIFTAVIKKLNEFELKEFLTLIGDKIQLIFENSKTCEPLIFATFMEIALLEPKYFALSPELVAMMAKASNMLTIGVIYLENRLKSLDWNSESVSVRSSSTISPEDSFWLHLSDIYNSLAEYDIVASIFSDKIKTDPRLSEAIELKSNGQYEEALNKLEEVIQRRILIEHYYAYNCYYECFIELSDWNSLSSAISDQVDSYDELWSDEYNIQFLLPKIIQSELQLVLEGKTYAKEFLIILSEWMKDPTKSEYIKSKFCEELMMLHITKNDYREARVYSENYLKSFIVEWGVVSSLYEKLRLENLLNAQKVSEIDNYALLMLENFNESSVDIMNRRWKNCSIGLNDSLKFWNLVISYRTYIAVLCVHRLENINSQELLITKDIQSTLFNMNLQFFNAIAHQKNYGLAEKILYRLSPSSYNVQHDTQKYLQYNISQIKFKILNSQRCKQLEQRFEIIEQAWIHTESTLNDLKTRNFISLNIETLKLNCDICEEILKISLEVPSLLQDNHEIQQRIKERTSKISNSESLNQRIFDQSLWSLEESVRLTDSSLLSLEDDDSNSNLKLKICNDIATSNYRLAQFCYDYYDSKFLNLKNYNMEKLCIKSVFKAMKYNSDEAKQLFPCILQLSSIENEFNNENDDDNEFDSFSNDVPEWMFLSWIPQILSRLKFHDKSFVDNIVLRISKKYPNALIYAFNLWCDRYDNEFYQLKQQQQSTIGIENNRSILRGTISEIMNSLKKNKLTNKFIENLKILCLPQILLISHLEKFEKEICNSSFTQQQTNRKNDYIQLINKLIQNVFESNEHDQRLMEEEELKRGNLYHNISKYKGVLEKLKELNIENDLKKVCEFIKNLKEKLKSEIIKNFKNKDKNEIQLKLLCPWLSEYQWCGEEDYIELPGQYSGDKHPNILQHIKIVKFDQKIKIFESQRYPIKLRMYGSNGKLYDFLIKFGEDLRQDQRIQEILKLMSGKLLKNDQHCKSHNLYINTFDVIPINRNCGIISWVENTCELFDFIFEYLKKNYGESQSKELYKKLFEIHNNFLHEKSKHIENCPESKMYSKAAAEYTREQIANNFNKLVNMIDLEILQSSLLEISISPESYFVLRNNFIRSLATLNISNWILGIGDRHLKNILFNFKNGTLTGIDFNCTFGTATRNLAIPELIPFRLTPHLVNLMEPIGTCGLLFKCMVHALRVFRNSKKLLLACMEVFIREPTINWIGNARRTIIRTNNDEDDDSTSRSANSNNDDDDDTGAVTGNWEPKDRINIAKCKLNGYNPVSLIERDLSVHNFNRFPEFLNGYIKLLKGNQQFNIRARLPENDLSPEMQVNSLIDLATDPAILGITYGGLLPWM